MICRGPTSWLPQGRERGHQYGKSPFLTKRPNRVQNLVLTLEMFAGNRDFRMGASSLYRREQVDSWWWILQRIPFPNCLVLTNGPSKTGPSSKKPCCNCVASSSMDSCKADCRVPTIRKTYPKGFCLSKRIARSVFCELMLTDQTTNKTTFALRSNRDFVQSASRPHGFQVGATMATATINRWC